MTDDQMLQLLLTGDIGVSYTAENGWQFTDCRHLLEQIPSADDDELPGESLFVEPRRRAGRPRGNYWPAEKVKPCGTRTAFLRHRAHGEDPCDPCIAAARDYYAAHARKRRANAKHIAGDRPLLHSVPREHPDNAVDEQVAS